MADQEPNVALGLKRSEVERDGMKLRYQQQELRLLEIEEEKERIRENMEATKKEVVNIEANIKKIKDSIDTSKE